MELENLSVKLKHAAVFSTSFCFVVVMLDEHVDILPGKREAHDKRIN
jgi:hypothetical protein